MAGETEKIVTVFEADLSGLEQGVSEYEKTLQGAEKTSASFDKSNKDLGASVGSLSPKFEAVRQSVQRSREEAAKLIAANKNLTDAQKQAAAAAGGITKEFNAITNAAKKTATATRQVAAETKKVGSGGLLGKLQGSFTSLGNGIKGAGIQAKGFFSQVISGAGSAIPGIGRIGASFSGMLGPIGIAVGAVAGFIANFSRLDSVKQRLDAIGTQFDLLGNRLAKGDIEGVLKQIARGRGGRSSDAEFAKDIAARLDRVEDAQLRVNAANAEAEQLIAAKNQQLRDATLSDEKRLEISDEIAKIEIERADREDKLLQRRINIQKDINAKELETLGEVSDANKAALNELEVQRTNAATGRIQLLESTERRANAITEQGSEARQRIAEKAAKEEEQRRATIAQAEAGINATLDQLAQERLLASADEAGKEVLVTEKKFADLLAKTKDGFEKIKAVTPVGGQAEVAQREADAVVAIEAAKDAELARLAQVRADADAKTQEANIEQLRKTLLTETELQREAALQALDADLALAETTLKTQEERDAFRLERVKQTEAEITAILTEEQKKQIENEKAANEERAQLAQENAQILADFAVGATEIVAAAAAGNEDIARDASKLLTGLLLDTLEKIIIANAFQVQAIAAGSPTPENIATGGVAGIVKGVLLAGLVKALFAVAKAQIIGAYTGEERVGVNERPQLPGTRDRYLRRVHKNEGIVDAKTNLEYLPEINAMRKGKFDDFIYAEHIAPAIAALGYGDMGAVNHYVQSDTGQRIAQSVMLAKFYDANIVSELQRNAKQGRAQVELLAQIARNGRRNASRW